MPMVIQMKGKTFGGGIQSGRRRSLFSSFSVDTLGRRAFNTPNVLHPGYGGRRNKEADGRACGWRESEQHRAKSNKGAGGRAGDGRRAYIIRKNHKTNKQSVPQRLRSSIAHNSQQTTTSATAQGLRRNSNTPNVLHSGCGVRPPEEAGGRAGGRV